MASEIDTAKFNSVSLYFTDDNEIRVINRDFRKKDKPTDVLSFASQDSTDIPVWENSLGELIISTETLIKQSIKYRVTSDQELLRLLIHGTLHLLGYDHEKVSKNKAALMMRKQRGLLTKLLKEVSFRSRNYFIIQPKGIKK